MEKLPTAEDILSKKFNELKSSFTLIDVQECMIEFAEMHAKQALKEAIKCLPYDDRMNQDLMLSLAIQKCYSKNNIK